MSGTLGVNQADISWKEYTLNWGGLMGENSQAVTTNHEKSAEVIVPNHVLGLGRTELCSWIVNESHPLESLVASCRKGLFVR